MTEENNQLTEKEVYSEIKKGTREFFSGAGAGVLSTYLIPTTVRTIYNMKKEDLDMTGPKAVGFVLGMVGTLGTNLVLAEKHPEWLGLLGSINGVGFIYETGRFAGKSVYNLVRKSLIKRQTNEPENKLEQTAQ